MKIVTDYRPSQTVLNRLRQVDFVAVIGPTAVGKTTLITAVLRKHPSARLIITDTNRAPRPGERDGADYHFRSREAMFAHIKNREYVNLAPSVTGDLYASHPDSYPYKGTGIMAVLADAVPYFKSLPFRSFRQVFIVPPDWSVWQARMETHRFTPEQRARRLLEAKESLQYALDGPDITFVINDDLDTAAADLWHRMQNESDIAVQHAGRNIAAELLRNIQ